MPVITQSLTPDLPEDEQTFLIGKIVNNRGGENRNNTTHYLVNWAGWGSKYDSWEPAEEIEKCADLLVAFFWENKVLKSSKAKQAQTASKNTLNAHENSKPEKVLSKPNKRVREVQTNQNPTPKRSSNRLKIKENG